jgi:hypothetical protein
MIENDRPQPELDFVLEIVSGRMVLQNLPSLSYAFECDHVSVNNELQLTRPSYSINIYAGSMLIAKVHYELDTRFGVEFKWAEAGRIENVLADRAISALMLNGVINLYMITKTTGAYGQFIIKESDVKLNLGLN